MSREERAYRSAIAHLRQAERELRRAQRESAVFTRRPVTGEIAVLARGIERAERTLHEAANFARTIETPRRHHRSIA